MININERTRHPNIVPTKRKSIHSHGGHCPFYLYEEQNTRKWQHRKNIQTQYILRFQRKCSRKIRIVRSTFNENYSSDDADMDNEDPKITKVKKPSSNSKADYRFFKMSFFMLISTYMLLLGIL